jgi:uncharacterized protein
MKKIVFTGLLISVFAIFLIIYRGEGRIAGLRNTGDSGLGAVSDSDGTPFDEITIPYLRNRDYKSSLGEMNLLSTYGGYSSYLTSYSSDGLQINALLTKPAGEIPDGGWPAIVFVHGYIPPPQYATTEKYVEYVENLAANGFVVFKIDLRGHGSSEGEPGGGYYSADYVIDTLNAYAALESADFVNKNEIGLWGHSMAGNVISRALAIKPGIPAAVIWAGAGFSYVDLSTYGLSDASYQPQPSDIARQRKRQRLRDIYGDPKDGNPFWKRVAVTGFLEDLQGAIQLHHAIDDATVDINYSRDFSKLLETASVDHELYEYPEGGHNIAGGSFSLAIQRTVDFYKKHLSG